MAYTEELRGKIDTKEFAGRLVYLETYFGPNTSIGHRLQAQWLFSSGNFAAASTEFSTAIATGFDDSETWYWLGEAEWKSNNLDRAENAFRHAIDAPIQIPNRLPWYLFRLSTLLAKMGRLDQALLIQEEAARLSHYYLNWDFLSVLYTQLGYKDQGQQACEQARILAGSAFTALQCEK